MERCQTYATVRWPTQSVCGSEWSPALYQLGAPVAVEICRAQCWGNAALQREFPEALTFPIECFQGAAGAGVKKQSAAVWQIQGLANGGLQ